MPDQFLRNKLECVYNMLAKLKKDFEVVLIFIRNLHVDGWEESCWGTFDSMPWLALPFRDESCKKLKRIFKLSNDGRNDSNKLVIVGPNAEFVEPFGTSVLLNYNISAYPFTRKKATELETEVVKELKLDMLMDPDTVLIGNYGEVSFSKLFGKRVMLVLERFDVDFNENNAYKGFLLMLRGSYLKTRYTDEFEVIRVIIDNTESCGGKHLNLGHLERLLSLDRNFAGILGFVTLASSLKLDLSSSHFWYGKSLSDFQSYFQIFAFERNGRLVRKTMYPTFENLEFPFYAGSLEEETSAQLSRILLN
ncbi:putative nucleoredoxin 1-1 [Apium graveolens]|uniref:putative nucleoredoxin 1-1 n=1 Tax=Apium graveolens TaxID=4045 RepID=UPI003D7B52CC